MGHLPKWFSARATVSPPQGERFFSFRPGRTGPLILAVMLLTGCRGTTADRGQASPVVTDDADRAVHLSVPAHRVVSLLPSVTELIVALGAGDRLIARTGFDTDPRIAHLPSLGRTLQPSTEAVAARAPDLVVTGPDRRGKKLVELLESLDVPAYVADVEDLAGLYSTVRQVGRLLGLSGPADSLAAEIESGLDRARECYDSVSRPTVVYLVWHDPPVIAGPGTYVDELISIAGGANAFADVAARWPTVSLEEIVRRDPDFIVIPRGNGHSIQPEWLRELPGWRRLRAVLEDRLVTVDSDVFNRPGPRVVEAAHTLGRALRSERSDVQP